MASIFSLKTVDSLKTVPQMIHIHAYLSIDYITSIALLIEVITSIALLIEVITSIQYFIEVATSINILHRSYNFNNRGYQSCLT